jgi:hypothetical protein
VFFVTFVTFVADLFFGIFVADRVLRKPSWLIVFFVTFVTFVADRALRDLRDLRGRPCSS